MATTHTDTALNGVPLSDDLFSQVIAPVLDDTRAIVEGLGLRTSKIYLVLDEYEGPGKREGALLNRILVELAPAPKIGFYSVRGVAGEQGQYRAGDIFLTKVTRLFTREQLEGKTAEGDDFDRKFDFSYAVLSKDNADRVEFYNIASRPSLHSTEWRLHLRPVNRFGPLEV